MTKKPNKKKIGLFLLIGLLCFGAITLHAVQKHFFQTDKFTTVMYFDESLKGLNVGSPVLFKGVQIGTVSHIELVSGQDFTFRAPVYAKITPMKKINTSNWNNFWDKKDNLRSLIQKGLRARLATQSYLTGQLMIELVMMPDSQIHLVQSARDTGKNIPEIPTILSPAGELSKGIQDFPFQQTISRLENVLTTLQRELPVLLPAITKTAQNMEKITDDILPVAGDTLDTANKTLNEISDAARSLRLFADYIEQHPEALLKGKKGN